MTMNTLELIRTTLRNQSSRYYFRPGAEHRIVKQFDKEYHGFDYSPVAIDVLERLIREERLTLSRPDKVNVGWQEWGLFRDQMV